MKKITKRLLSVGLCAALALSVGCGLAACGGDDGNETKKPTPTPTPVETVPVYYLAGSGSIFQATKVGEGTEAVGGEWYASYTTEEDVPESILFTLKEEGGKEYELTVTLEVDDEFAVVIVGKAWAGQMGFNRVGEQEEEYLVEGGGYDTKNIKVAEAGEYTFTLDMSGTFPVITYDFALAPVAVSSVTLNKPSLSLTVGDDETLEATVAPDDAADKTVTWSSSDEEVATVDQTGKVTAVAAGTATITAQAGDKTADCAVTVVAAGTEIVEVESITLNKSATTLTVTNPTETLTATVAPENATNKAVAYTSSDETVATVDATGKITALKPGTATITATAGDNKTDTCEVTVPETYFMIGVDPLGWGVPATFNRDHLADFAFTETEDGTFTLTVSLNKNNGFKFNKVGGGDSDYLDTLTLEEDDENFEKSGNIVVKKGGKFTFTMVVNEETGARSFTYERIGEPDVPDITTTDYYLLGNGADYNAWTPQSNAATAKNVFTDKGDGTYELVVQFTGGEAFKIGIIGSGWTNAIGAQKEGATAIQSDITQAGFAYTAVDGSADITVGAENGGWYKITLTVSEGNVTITCEATTAPAAE